MIKQLIIQKSSCHWYNKAGQAVFQVPAKKGGLKNTTVTDARELDLIPSVTTILRVIDKPEIDLWKIGRAIKASIASRRRKGERISQFINRIIELMDKPSSKAVNFGLKTHEAIEAYIKTKQALSPVIAQILSKFNTFTSEKAYSNQEFAGTIDITCKDTLGIDCLIDIKTQKSKAGKKFNIYDDYYLQLAAYDLLKPSQKYYILFISSTEENRAELIEIPCNEIDKAKKIFMNLLEVFNWKNELGEYKKAVL